jgi:hypothetical protein
VGNCCVFSPSVYDGGLPTEFRAGTITVKDGTSTISTIMPGATNQYTDSNSTDAGLVWKAGDVVTFSGSGDVVHAFSAQVTAVEDVAGLMPALSLTSPPFTISLSADFVLSWTPSTGNGVKVIVGLLAYHGGSIKDLEIQCQGMDSAGTMTVPKSLLSNLPQSDSCLVGISRYSASTVVSDNVSGTLTSETHAWGNAQLAP